VDCGVERTQSWHLPLSLISRLKSVHDREYSFVILSRDKEQRFAKLSSLGFILRAKSLLRFVLQPKSDNPEWHYNVVDVGLANVYALVRLFSHVL
jgi:hypothetical protein